MKKQNKKETEHTMKLKHIGTLLLATLAVATACDDNTGSLGMSMLPPSDGLTAHVSTFNVKTESVLAGAVFAKTSTGYVGKFTDPDFGSYEASFLTELNSTGGELFPEVYRETEWDAEGNPTKGEGLLYKKDSLVAAQLYIYYNDWFGDSLNACRMSVYELDKPLEKNYYTDINPEEFYDTHHAKLLGQKAYSPDDTSVSDSVRNATDSNGDPIYSPHIAIDLNREEFEQRILLTYREHPEYFSSPEAFRDNVFKGMYIKNDLGDGTVLYVDQVALVFQLCLHYTDDETGVALKKADGTDSLYTSSSILFASTKEIIQANHFVNSQLLKERSEEPDWTYIKSPAGIFTQATMPYDDIYQQLTNDTLNAVRLTFTNYKQESTYDYSMSAPNQVLLIRKQDMKEFFEDNQLPDNITSFTTTHNSVNTNQYTFQNIARLVTTCINEKQAARNAAGDAWDEAQWIKDNPDWDKVMLVPVSVEYDDNYYSTPTIIRMQHDLRPGFAKLKGGPAMENGELKNPLQLEVISTTFHD